MKTLQEPLQLRAAQIDELATLIDKEAEYDAAKAEIASLDKQIERKKEADKLAAESARTVTATEPAKKTSVPAAPKKVYALKHIQGENNVERAHMAGAFWLAMAGNEKAISRCRENGIVEVKALSEGINSAGGALVPSEVASEIIVLRNQYGLARRDLRVMPMGRDTMTIPKIVSGLTAYFTGEGVAATQSQPVWSNVGLTAKKSSILTVYSSELDEDAFVEIGDILTEEMAYAYAVLEDTCLFSGDGTSAYGGMTGLRTIFNAGVGSLAGAVDAASGHDTMAELDATDLAAVQGKLPQYVYTRGNPKWYCSQTMWANVFERLIGASGGVTKDQASGRTVREYNGYPVEITPAMLAPASATTDASDVAMILFGDLNMSATMGDRRGVTISRSTEYKFAEDQIAIKGTERFDINCHNTGDTTTAGSIVALMGE